MNDDYVTKAEFSALEKRYDELEEKLKQRYNEAFSSLATMASTQVFQNGQLQMASNVLVECARIWATDPGAKTVLLNFLREAETSLKARSDLVPRFLEGATQLLNSLRTALTTA